MTKKRRIDEVKEREEQKKKMFETIAKTKSHHTPIEHYKNNGKGVSLGLLAEAGFKFAEEDKDFLHKTKEELDKENKEIKQLNESFLGLGNFAVVNNPFDRGDRGRLLKEKINDFKNGKLVAEDYGDELRISCGPSNKVFIPKNLITADFINFLSRSR